MLIGFSYAAVPFFTLGIGSAVPFVYAAVRRRSPLQTGFAVFYVVCTGLVASMTGAQSGSTLSAIAKGCEMVLWAGASAHAFAVGATGALRAPARRDTPPPVLPSDVNNRRALAELERRRALRGEARALAAHDLAAAYELRVGRPDLPQTFDDGGLVDVNHVPASVLATLPGIDASTAARLVEQREARGGFISVEDMALDTTLPPDLLPRLAEVAVFLP